MNKMESKNYSIEIKSKFEAFDYRGSLELVMADIYVDEIRKVIKTLPSEENLPAGLGHIDKLWSEEPDLVEIFYNLCLNEFDKRIKKRLEKEIDRRFGV